VDQALMKPEGVALQALYRLRRSLGTTTLAERVRHRATALARRNRSAGARILAMRDALIEALYRDTSPKGWFNAWCDGSARPDGPASIGALVLDPDSGGVVAQISRAADHITPFEAEVAALEAVLEVAVKRDFRHMRVHTDCRALVELWRAHRADPRLARVRSLVHRLDRLELRAVPRLHNQPAHRLARES
jgi:ribonuclease HI